MDAPKHMAGSPGAGAQGGQLQLERPGSNRAFSREEFNEWLLMNGQHFRLMEYEPWEIYHVAMLCGFSMADMSEPLVEWVKLSNRKLALYNSPLFGQWVSLQAYQRSGTMWE